MRAYSVHAPPGEALEPERFAFVKDGIAWPALFVPALWMFWHRLWLVLLAYLAYVVALAALGRFVGEGPAVTVALLGALLLALEANNLRRWSLRRRGWQEVGSGSGRDLEEAELRFFQTWTSQAATPRAESRAPAYAPRRRDEDEPILGLFPEAER
jgi:hypothetical protein